MSKVWLMQDGEPFSHSHTTSIAHPNGYVKCNWLIGVACHEKALVLSRCAPAFLPCVCSRIGMGGRT